MSNPQTTKFDTSEYVELPTNPIWVNGWNAAIEAARKRALSHAVRGSRAVGKLMKEIECLKKQ